MSLFRFLATTLIAIAPLVQPVAAQTGIIPIGSPLVFGGDNDPDTFTAVTTFGPTPVLVDNGALSIWQEQVADSPTSEWDVFYMKTTSGGPIAGDINANWAVLLSYDLSAPAYFDQVLNQWQVNGVPVGPLTDGVGSLCCASATNPVISGYSYYNSGFSSPLAAGVQMNWQQIYVDPYNYIADGGVDPSTANEFIFALHFTLQPATSTFTTALAAGYAVEPFAPESIVTAFGTNLATGTGNADVLPLPTTLDGTSMTITDSAAVIQPMPMYFASPLQINYEIPPGVAQGYATVTLTPDGGAAQSEQIQIGAISPGLFALDPAGLVGAWVLPVDSGVQQPLRPVYQYEGNDLAPLPVDISAPNEQIYLELYGTGIRYANAVTVTVGGVSVPVLYAGAAPNEVGEDQVNIGPLPLSLAGAGSVNIVLTADKQTANTVNITIQ